MNIIYTVCNRNNLAHALLLAESLSRHQPESHFILAWVDTLPLDSLPQNLTVLHIPEMQIPEFEKMQSSYYDFELLAAVRPWAALTVLRNNPECALLTFFAPTVLVVQPVTTITENPEDLFLTPHLAKPMVSNNQIDDKRILNIGMFHSGSWMLRPTVSTRSFLQWWSERTLDRASFDLCNGMNQDQLWLNYAPTWIKETMIIRHPGWHYGLHAIPNRNLILKAKQYLVDGLPLLTIDFAGLDFYDPIWSDHVRLASQNRAFRQLLRDYRQNLDKFAPYQPSGTEAGYGKTFLVKKNRLLRSRLAAKLKSFTDYIDRF